MAAAAPVAGNPARQSTSSPRRQKARRGAHSSPAPKNNIIEIQDTDDETEEDTADHKRRREAQTFARQHLNDHVRESAEQSVHPLLDSPLFPSRLGADSSHAAAPSSPSHAIYPPPQGGRTGLDVTERPPSRPYAWARSASSSSSNSDRSVRSHKQGLKHKKSLRDAGDSSQLAMIIQMRQKMERNGQTDGLEALRRVEAQYEAESRSPKKSTSSFTTLSIAGSLTNRTSRPQCKSPGTTRQLPWILWGHAQDTRRSFGPKRALPSQSKLSPSY